MTFAPLLPDLGIRRLEPEAMDDPHLGTRQLMAALRGLERLNQLSRSARIVWQPIRELALQKPSRPLRVLDIATGMGGTPLALWRWAARSGLKISVDGCDRSHASLELARRRALREGAPIRFFRLDVAESPLPEGYDVLTSSLFLHHLTQGQALHLLRSMDHAAGKLALVSDLVRCPQGMQLAKWASRFLQRSSVVRSDAVLSIRGAFTPEEAGKLLARAGVRGAEVSVHWPYRFLLAWRTAR